MFFYSQPSTRLPQKPLEEALDKQLLEPFAGESHVGEGQQVPREQNPIDHLALALVHEHSKDRVRKRVQAPGGASAIDVGMPEFLCIRVACPAHPDRNEEWLDYPPRSIAKLIAHRRAQRRVHVNREDAGRRKFVPQDAHVLVAALVKLHEPFLSLLVPHDLVLCEVELYDPAD